MNEKLEQTYTLLTILLIISLVYWYFFIYRNNIIEFDDKNSIKEIRETFIINMPSRVDKWDRISEHLKNFPNITKSDGVSVDKIPENSKLRKCQLGCSLAHLKIYEKIISYNDKESWYVIFEDDAMYKNDNSSEALEKVQELLDKIPDDSVAVHLGLKKYSPRSTQFLCTLKGNPFNDSIYRGFPDLLHAYMINQNGAELFEKIVRNEFLITPCDTSLYNYLFSSRNIYATSIFDQYRPCSDYNDNKKQILQKKV